MAPDSTLRAPRLINTDGLEGLYQSLVAQGYRVIGPAVQDGAEPGQ